MSRKLCSGFLRGKRPLCGLLFRGTLVVGLLSVITRWAPGFHLYLQTLCKQPCCTIAMGSVPMFATSTTRLRILFRKAPIHPQPRGGNSGATHLTAAWLWDASIHGHLATRLRHLATSCDGPTYPVLGFDHVVMSSCRHVVMSSTTWVK